MQPWQCAAAIPDHRSSLPRRAPPRSPGTGPAQRAARRPVARTRRDLENHGEREKGRKRHLATACDRIRSLRLTRVVLPHSRVSIPAPVHPVFPFRASSSRAPSFHSVHSTRTSSPSFFPVAPRSSSSASPSTATFCLPRSPPACRLHLLQTLLPHLADCFVFLLGRPDPLLFPDSPRHEPPLTSTGRSMSRLPSSTRRSRSRSSRSTSPKMPQLGLDELHPLHLPQGAAAAGPGRAPPRSACLQLRRPVPHFHQDVQIWYGVSNYVSCWFWHGFCFDGEGPADI